jgi:hypothetical protein
MTGNIIGEELDEFVGKQVNTRQSIAGKGYDSLNPRSQTSQIYQNGRNAWVKLASGVNVIGDGIITDSEGVFDTSQVDTGEQRLIDIGLGANFSGLELAKKAVLFNGLAKVNPSTLKMKDGEYEIDETTQTPIIDQPGSYQFRQGVSKSKGFWNSGKAYGLGGTEFGLQPMPGIESVEVQALNRGSIKKATVTIKAFNKFQLDVIELLYLRLGYVMMLEWGWDKYYKDENTLVNTGNTIIEDYWFDQGKCTSLLKLYDFVRVYREKYNANYDGFVGRVTNYQWSFNSDGSYDVILEMYSIGDIVESLRSNVPVGDKTGAQFISGSNNNRDEYNEQIEKGQISEHRDNEICFWLWNSTFDQNNFINPENKNFFKIPINVTAGPGSPKKVNKYGTDYTTLKLKSPPNIKYQYFIRLGYFLEEFQERVIPYVAPCEKISDPILRIDTDIETNLISLYDDQFSLDPRVCIHNLTKSFPNYGSWGADKDPAYGLFVSNKYSTYASGSDVIPVNRNPLENFTNIEKKRSTVKKFSPEETHVISGKLMNLYINYECIYQIFENNIDRNTGAISVFTFLSELCTEINGAFANTVQLEPIIDEGEIIKLIDLNPLVRKKPKKEDRTYFEIYGYSPESKSNFVRDLSFNTFIDGKLGSQLAIGAAAPGKNPKSYEGAGLQYWNRGLGNRYINQLVLNENPYTYSVSKQIEDAKKDLASYWENYSGLANTIVNTFLNNSPMTLYYSNLKKTLEYNGKWYWNVYQWEFAEQAYSDDQIKARKQQSQQLRSEFLISPSLDYRTYVAYAIGGVTSKGYTSINDTTLGSLIISYSDSLYFSCNPNFIELGKSLWQNLISKRENISSKLGYLPISYKGFIPLSFNLTLEGLSGIKIYNRLNLKQQFLPTQYKEGKFEYIIKQVNHQISDNDWTTQINSFSYPDLNLDSLERYKDDDNLPETPQSTIEENRPDDPLSPLKELIAKGESKGGDYTISNFLYKSSPTQINNEVAVRTNLDVTTLTIKQILDRGQINTQITENRSQALNNGRIYATGKYQLIPTTLKLAIQSTEGVTENDLYTPEVQEKLFNYLLFSKRPKVGAYINGADANTGAANSKLQLELAITSLAREFSSVPTIFPGLRSENRVGIVDSGVGSRSYYGGADKVYGNVGEVAKALIQSRIYLTGLIPEYLPDYVQY